MARLEERDLFARTVLADIGAASERLGDGAMVDGFLSMEGPDYDGAMMVVGRAVNGWGSGILAKTLADSKAAEKFAEEVYASVNGSGPRPMLWVTDQWHGSERETYRTARSAFWRAIRRVTAELGIAQTGDSSWPSHLVWSNLYKVATHSAGNPNAALCDMQLPGCLELLELELSIYRPRRLLLLTGHDWAAPFLERLSFSLTRFSDAGMVRAVGTVPIDESGASVRFVVAVHPQGKSEDDWVREVVDAFRE